MRWLKTSAVACLSVAVAACGSGGSDASPVDRRVCKNAYEAAAIALGVVDRDYTDYNRLAVGIEVDAGKISDRRIRSRANDVVEAFYAEPVGSGTRNDELFTGQLGRAFGQLANACNPTYGDEDFVP